MSETVRLRDFTEPPVRTGTPLGPGAELGGQAFHGATDGEATRDAVEVGVVYLAVSMREVLLMMMSVLLL